MTSPYEKRLLRVFAHIEDNLTGDLSLDVLADVAAMSRFHWHRVFTAMTGETGAQVIRRIRLHRAASLLVHSDATVASVAATVGYANPRSFSKAFTESFGQTPAAFRAEGRLLPALFNATKGDYPVYPIEITTTPGYRLAARPHRGAYTSIGTTFEALSTLASSRNLWPHVRGMVGVYYDDPDAVDEAALRSHGGLAVTEEAEIADPLEEVKIAPGDVAVMHYKGPYAGLAAAYKHLYGVWLPESGKEPSDMPPYEVYLNNPKDTAPEDLLTDVCVPLK